MTDRLVVAPRYQSLLTRHGITHFAALKQACCPDSSATLPVELFPGQWDRPQADPVAYFAKRYQYPRPSLKFFLRASKPEREFQNYLRFQAWDLPTADPIAWGESRDTWGRLQEAVIVTQTIPETRPLPDYWVTLSADPPSAPRKRNAVIGQIAHLAQTLHAHHFHHRDFVWRNFLVNEAEGHPRVHLLDCPRGTPAGQLFRNRGRIKDLASLDKRGSLHCRRTERLRFFLAYSNIATLDPAHKQLARAVQAYRRERWPEDWVSPDAA